MHRPQRTDLWWWHDVDDTACWGFTSRRGGASVGSWAGLNLGQHVGDDADHVAANRATLAAGLGVAAEQVHYMDQVHGAAVTEVTAVGQRCAETDGIISQLQVAVAVMVADCVPVLLADRASSWIGAAHAGRPGMAAGVVPATVAALREAGATDLVAVVGPSISPRNYEVPEQMCTDVAAVEPTAASVTGWGTPAVDVAAGVLSQLHRLGVPCRTIPGCTAEEPDLFSYRRDGQTGRFAGVVMKPVTR